MFIGDFSNRWRFSAAFVVVLFLFSTSLGSEKVICVDPGNSIQAAVNNSTSGDLIIVKAGEYQENVVVNVSGIKISSEFDNPENVLVKARDLNSSVFQVKANNVTISGFSITRPMKISSLINVSSSANSSFMDNNSSNLVNSSDFGDLNLNKTYNYGSSNSVSSNSGSNSHFKWNGIGCPPAGICLEQVNNCTIENNRIFENRYGAYLQNSRNNTLLNNTLPRNNIWLDEGCGDNVLVNNTIEESNIVIGAHCWDNIIFQNMLSNGEGISIACCGGNNLVSRNEIINCTTGIDIYDVQARTVLCDNMISDCEKGIYLTFVFDSRVYNNTISKGNTGIILKEECNKNELSNNKITATNESGIYLLDYSAGNRIYNNYFNNSINVKIENAEGNTWNTTQSPGTNIVGGQNLGGNFWANLEGTDFSQVSNDSNSDGICDFPFKINGSEIDYLPLAKPPSITEENLTVTIGLPETNNNTLNISMGINRNTQLNTLYPVNRQDNQASPRF